MIFGIWMFNIQFINKTSMMYTLLCMAKKNIYDVHTSMHGQKKTSMMYIYMRFIHIYIQLIYYTF